LTILVPYQPCASAEKNSYRKQAFSGHIFQYLEKDSYSKLSSDLRPFNCSSEYVAHITGPAAGDGEWSGKPLSHTGRWEKAADMSPSIADVSFAILSNQLAAPYLTLNLVFSCV